MSSVDLVDMFSKNTTVEDFTFALQKDPTRKDTQNGTESLLICVVKWKDINKLKLLVSLGCVNDENMAAEKCQGLQNDVKVYFVILL